MHLSYSTLSPRHTHTSQTRAFVSPRKLFHWIALLFVANIACSFSYSKNSKRDEFIVGETTHFNGRRLMTWAVIDSGGEIKEVGVTIPLALIEQQPDRPGDGPAGAIASLAFPKIVQQAT